MNSEKVKEIKEKLREEIFIANSFGDKLRKVPTKELENLQTLINEFERENESCHEVLADLKTIIKQQNDRIAELETKNKALTDGIKQEISYKKVERDKLHRLVEDVKKFTRDNVDANTVDGFVKVNIYLEKILKEEG